MDSIWNWPFHDHSMIIPYGIHDVHGTMNWLWSQPPLNPWIPHGIPHGFHGFQVDSIWIIPGKVKTSFFLKTFWIALSIGTKNPTSLRGPVEIKPTVSNFHQKKDNSPWSFFICINPTSECSPSLHQPPLKVWRASGGLSKLKLTLWDFYPENNNLPLSFFILINPTYEHFLLLYQPPPKVWPASECLQNFYNLLCGVSAPHSNNLPLSFFIHIKPTYERSPSIYQLPPKVWRASEGSSKSKPKTCFVEFPPQNDNPPLSFFIHPNHKPCASDIHCTPSTFSCPVWVVNGCCSPFS